MNSKIYKKVIKFILIAMIFILGMIGVGCDTMEKYINKEDYVVVALEKLKMKYGEEFEVSALGGSFGATRDSYKLVCNPINDKNKRFNVEVSSDLSQVDDDYIGRIMEEKLESEIYNIVANTFGKDIKIKSIIDAMFSKYDSLEMTALDYLEMNNDVSIGFYIFMKTDNEINTKEQSKLIYKFMQDLIDNGIVNDCGVSVFYLKENCYFNLENDYYDKRYNGFLGVYDFYSISENSYGYGSGINQNGQQRYTLEDIEDTFKKN